MNKTEETKPSGQWRVSSEGSERDLEECVPLTVRNARQMRKALQALEPYCWMSFASIIILAAALAILAYRMGAQSCLKQ